LQLERADVGRRRDVGTTTEVEEVTLLVGRDRLTFGESLNQLDLVGIGLEDLQSLLSRDDVANEGLGLGPIGAHPAFDLFEVVRTQWPRQVHIVVEPMFNRRADCELGVRKNLLDGLGHEVGTGVPHPGQLVVPLILGRKRNVHLLGDLLYLFRDHSVTPLATENKNGPRPMRDVGPTWFHPTSGRTNKMRRSWSLITGRFRTDLIALFARSAVSSQVVFPVSHPGCRHSSRQPLWRSSNRYSSWSTQVESRLLSQG
jgi:hypothetical protein